MKKISIRSIFTYWLLKRKRERSSYNLRIKGCWEVSAAENPARVVFVRKRDQMDNGH
jgi:hypothetical protein